MMRRTTTALALAGVLAAVPAAADAADLLEAPIAGHPTVAAQMSAEESLNLRRDLTARAVRLARRLDISAAGERRRLRGVPTGALRGRIRVLERRLAAPPVSPVLEAIAACESGGDPTTDTGNGFYGKYQFTLETWAAVGGSGNPAHASEAEQDRRAAILYDAGRPFALAGLRPLASGAPWTPPPSVPSSRSCADLVPERGHGRAGAGGGGGAAEAALAAQLADGRYGEHFERGGR